jgi:hypothetical protein
MEEFAEEPETTSTSGYLKDKSKAAIDYIGHTKLVNPVRRNLLALKRGLTDGILDKEDDNEDDSEDSDDENKKRNGPISETLIGSIFKILKFVSDLFREFLNTPFVSEIGFFIFAIVFGIVFYRSNISYNGNTNTSVFMGYCVFSWIITFLIIIFICQLLHIFRTKIA